MSGEDSERIARERRAMILAQRMAAAYAEAAPAPGMDNPAKASLIVPLAAHLRQGIAIGLTDTHLGGYVKSVIVQWEQAYARRPGPYFFQINAHDEVVVIPDQRPPSLRR